MVGRGAEPDILQQARDSFEAALVEEPERGKVISFEERQLRRALGVA